MPQSIPFDPSLVLGNLVHEKNIETLNSIAVAEKPVNTAQNQLNAAISAKRKLDMTLQEMLEMNVPAKELKAFSTTIDQVSTQIVSCATDYGAKTIAFQKSSEGKEAAAGNIDITEMPESPIDWNKSKIQKFPISSDSMICDAQYVRNENETDGSSAHANSVAVSASSTFSSIFGPKVSGSMGTSIKNAVLAQTTKHKIVGTLVITATCTHQKADIFAPFILDPEKAVAAWNLICMSPKLQGSKSSPKGKDMRIETTNQASLESKIDKPDVSKFLTILSGQTIGSSFVGMVHVLQAESTDSSQRTNAASAKIASEFEYGGFFASGKGTFGVDSDFSDNVKSLLSNSELTSHCSLVTMGIIPSLKSDDAIKTSISAMQQDPSKVMGQLSAIQAATDGDVQSVAAGAEKAKTGKQFITLNNSYIATCVSELTKSDTNKNRQIDVNSLMTAFDKYVDDAKGGLSGVPINFFLRQLDSPAICKAWLSKFSPQRNWQNSSNDDASTGVKKDKNTD
jgi:hypothetical protein